MTVRRDFQRLYAEEDDPWAVGDAAAERYDFVCEIVRELGCGVPYRKGIDLGCGKGALTARVAAHVQEMWGIDISSTALGKAQARFPGIRFLQADLGRAKSLPLSEGVFDLVLCLDVLYYLGPRQRLACLNRAERLLSDSGVAVFVAWTPGGDEYFTPDEFLRLVGHSFHVQFWRVLETQHVVIAARRRWRDVILSLDYETWQPIPQGKRIDWNEDVLLPTAGLMQTAEGCGARLTLMAEMAEYYWLRTHRPAVAEAVANQLQQAVARGHDVQLHLHPSWLPELGARHEPGEGGWSWDARYQRLHDLPFHLEELLRRCKQDLETLLQPRRPSYRTLAFRAGKYQVQPSLSVFRALAGAGFQADSSVWKGGYEPEHSFDFRSAFSATEPYWASAYQANYLAPSAEEKILELPIATHNGRQLSLDGLKAEQLLASLGQMERDERVDRLALRFPRAVSWLKRRWSRSPWLIEWFLNTRFRRWLYATPLPVSTLVFIGHPKVGIPTGEFATFLNGLRALPGLRFRTVQEVVEERVHEQTMHLRFVPKRGILAYQIARDREAVMGEERNWRQSDYLQRRVPPDRTHILDLGCGAGYWTKRLTELIAPTIGVDAGHEFLVKAKGQHRVPVVRADLAFLPFVERSFDAVYADNSLEHAADPDRVLREAYRILGDKGVLVTMIPPDARHPEFSGTDHLWKTDRDEIELRLQAAGFTGLRFEEVDTARCFGMAPYLPSADAMLVVAAWKWSGGFSIAARAADLMAWLYARLSPERNHEGVDPEAILEKGYAWCEGYVNVFQHLLAREGIQSRIATLKAFSHPKGRGEAGEETHDVAEVKTEGGWVVFDPMANKCLGHALCDLLRQPQILSVVLADQPVDVRFRARNYQLYCSAWFYEHVAEVSVRPTCRESLRYVARELFLSSGADEARLAERGEAANIEA